MGPWARRDETAVTKTFKKGKGLQAISVTPRPQPYTAVICGSMMQDSMLQDSMLQRFS